MAKNNKSKKDTSKPVSPAIEETSLEDFKEVSVMDAAEVPQAEYKPASAAEVGEKEGITVEPKIQEEELVEETVEESVEPAEPETMVEDEPVEPEQTEEAVSVLEENDDEPAAEGLVEEPKEEPVAPTSIAAEVGTIQHHPVKVTKRENYEKRRRKIGIHVASFNGW